MNHSNNQQPHNTNIRVRSWEKLYPGCTEDFIGIFDSPAPTPKQVAKWKTDWILETPFRFLLHELPIEDGVSIEPETLYAKRAKALVEKTAKAAGIHPYFYEFWVEEIEVYDKDVGLMGLNYTLLNPFVAFFKGEHLVMFKLSWQH